MIVLLLKLLKCQYLSQAAYFIPQNDMASFSSTIHRRLLISTSRSKL